MKTEQLPLVTFEQAKRLKELGFDWIKNPCYKNGELTHEPVLTRKYKGIEDICFASPTVALALEWFREEKGIESGLSPARIFDFVRYAWWYSIDGNITATSDGKKNEAAESALLDELLDILEKEKKQWLDF